MSLKRLLSLLAAAQLMLVHSPIDAATAKHHASTSSRATQTRTQAVRKSLDDLGLRSSSVLVFDESHSSVLYSKRANVALPIASITKLMTALVVLEAKQPLDERIKITENDRIRGKGAFSRLATGTTLTRGELLRLALMSSENRAAYILGRRYPGGLSACVAAMNAKAKALGMKSARFVEPTGLSSKNVASARDLSKLVSAASKNSTIAAYSTEKQYAVRVGKQKIEFHNTNSLIGNPTWEIMVQKTGYIAEAGKCLVMQAVIEGRQVVIVLLNSVGKYTRVADARRIRRWMEGQLVSGGIAYSTTLDSGRATVSSGRRSAATPSQSSVRAATIMSPAPKA
jgi:serine-type D-Ala-D-Ala endopeptidase (penicillin-binding protein 7)